MKRETLSIGQRRPGVIHARRRRADKDNRAERARLVTWKLVRAWIAKLAPAPRRNDWR